MNVSSAKERGLVNESWGTTAVVRPHVFLARKVEAHSGEVTLWRAVAAILRGHQGTRAEVGERVPRVFQGFFRKLGLPPLTVYSG